MHIIYGLCTCTCSHVDILIGRKIDCRSDRADKPRLRAVDICRPPVRPATASDLNAEGERRLVRVPIINFQVRFSVWNAFCREVFPSFDRCDPVEFYVADLIDYR